MQCSFHIGLDRTNKDRINCNILFAGVTSVKWVVVKVFFYNWLMLSYVYYNVNLLS